MKLRSLCKISLVAAALLVQSATAQHVSLSPSRLYYKVGEGEYKSQSVNVTNNATYKQSFSVSFADFEPAGYQGKSKFMEAGESENSCSKWLTASPSFFELEPGQTQKIEVLMQVPQSPDANKVKWSAMKIKLTKEKQTAGDGDKNAIGMGITETFQFVVHVFQSPPSVTFKNAEISSFKDITAAGDSSRVLALMVKNTGEAILDCASYIELTNLKDGHEERMKPIAFTVLPNAEREVKFNLSPLLPPGKYSIMGVVDYGSRENVQAAEVQLEIK